MSPLPMKHHRQTKYQMKIARAGSEKKDDQAVGCGEKQEDLFKADTSTSVSKSTDRFTAAESGRNSSNVSGWIPMINMSHGNA